MGGAKSPTHRMTAPATPYRTVNVHVTRRPESSHPSQRQSRRKAAPSRRILPFPGTRSAFRTQRCRRFGRGVYRRVVRHETKSRVLWVRPPHRRNASGCGREGDRSAEERRLRSRRHLTLISAATSSSAPAIRTWRTKRSRQSHGLDSSCHVMWWCRKHPKAARSSAPCARRSRPHPPARWSVQ